MPSVNLGRVGLVLKGAWNSTTTYVPLDLVSYDGNSWAAKRQNTNVTPNTTNSDDWQLISNNADLVATVQGYKEDAEAAATAAEEALASIPADYTSLWGTIAEPFSTSDSYSAGQYITYNGGLYRFFADHAAGDWTGTDAEQIVVTDELIKQEVEFENLDDMYIEFPAIEQGNIQNGANSTSSLNMRVRSAGYLSTSNITWLKVDRSVKPYRTFVRYFTSKSSSGYVSDADADFQTEYVPINDAYPYFRIVVVDMTGDTTQNLIAPEAVRKAYTFYRPSTIDRALGLAKNAENQTVIGWEQGNIQNGEDSSSSYNMRVRTIGYIETSKVSEFRIDRSTKPWRTYLFYFTGKSAANHVSAADVNYSREIVKIDSTYPYFRAVAVDMTGGTTQNDITPSQVSADYSAYELSSLYKDIEELDTRMDEYEDSYPSYFDSQVSTVTTAVLNHKRLVGMDGFSFLFATDLHWSQNAKNSPPLIRAMVNKTQTPCVILGGDYISQFPDSKTDAMNSMQACIDAVVAKGIRDYVFPIFGNHDRNSNQTTSSVYMTKAETYAIINSWMSQRAVYADAYFDFYIDDEKSKTRIICIDTGAQNIDGGQISTATMNWISASINSLASDWHVIVVAHWLWSPTTWNHPLVDGVPTGSYTSYAQALFTALDTNNATSGKAKVEGIITGHVHCDFEDSTTGGIPIIFVDTDSKGAYGNYPATTGTISEQCFDVITFDYTAHKIYCDRIGRGVSRVYPSGS